MSGILNWKMGLAALAVVAGLAYLVAGSGGSGYVPPQADRVTVEPRADFNRAKFAEAVRALAPGRLIGKIEKGLSDHEVRLTAGPAWEILDAGGRQQAATAFWKAWAELHPENQRYKARIVITDARGAKIGGSRLLDPSKIWVRER
jgi:hypothetical protein